MKKYQIEIEASNQKSLRKALVAILTEIKSNSSYKAVQRYDYSYEFINITDELLALHNIRKEDADNVIGTSAFEIINGKECVIIQSKMNDDEKDHESSNYGIYSEFVNDSISDIPVNDPGAKNRAS